jgi:hypothetical protein
MSSPRRIAFQDAHVCECPPYIGCVYQKSQCFLFKDTHFRRHFLHRMALTLISKEGADFNVHFTGFAFLFLFRYVRAVVNWLTYLSYKPAISLNPPFNPSDLTIVIPTTSL